MANHSIFDVQRCLRDVQASYECRVGHAADPFQGVAPTIGASLATSSPTVFNKSKAKARVWLTGLSEKLLHYGNIFDVLIQHHPEYVSLAWGTFKLLFVVSLLLRPQYRWSSDDLQGNHESRRSGFKVEQVHLTYRGHSAATLAACDSLPDRANADIRREALCAHIELLRVLPRMVQGPLDRARLQVRRPAMGSQVSARVRSHCGRVDADQTPCRRGDEGRGARHKAGARAGHEALGAGEGRDDGAEGRKPAVGKSVPD